MEIDYKKAREMVLTSELVALCHRDVTDPGPEAKYDYFVDADYEKAVARLLKERPKSPFWSLPMALLSGNRSFQRRKACLAWLMAGTAPSACTWCGGSRWRAPKAWFGRWFFARIPRISITTCTHCRLNRLPMFWQGLAGIGGPARNTFIRPYRSLKSLASMMKISGSCRNWWRKKYGVNARLGVRRMEDSMVREGLFNSRSYFNCRFQLSLRTLFHRQNYSIAR